MASEAPNTILLTINGEHRPLLERVAGASDILPGYLVAIDGDNEIAPHDAEGGDARPLFVLESPYAQDHTQPAIDQAYTENDLARVVFAQPGDVIYAWLAAGEDVDIGDALESAGDGTLQEHTPTEISGTGPHTIPSRAIVAYAEEAVDANVGTSPPDARIRVRVA